MTRNDSLKPGGIGIGRAPICAGLLLALALYSKADLVEMRNGDQYAGKVTGLDAGTLSLQSEVLGVVKLPRDKIARITFGERVAASAQKSPMLTNGLPRANAARPTNAPPGVAAIVRPSGIDSALVQQVQDEFLNEAGPEAKAKFNEMLGGFLSGKLTVADIRAQAKTAADQLRSFQAGGTANASPELEGYLAVLDKFLAESAPAGTAFTNAPVIAPKTAGAETGKSAKERSE